MKTEKTKAQNNPKSNWFKLISIILVVFIFIRNDNRLHIDIDTAKLKSFFSVVSLKQENKKNYKNKGNDDEFGVHIIDVQPDLSLHKELEKMGKEKILAYLKRFSDVAINERRKYGIPSSIILANALLYSTAGNNTFVKETNNHFSLECTPDWNGKKKTIHGICLRHYKNSWSSFRDFSLFITSGDFKSLRKLNASDYRTWAKRMADMGFSREENYQELIVHIIEQYKLFELDSL